MKQAKQSGRSPGKAAPATQTAGKAKAKSTAATLPGQGRGDIVSDILGSYTGTPDGGGRPEQDADDL